MLSAKATLVAVAITLFTSANAHMTMVTPTPFGAATLNNSPMSADGSDFPCKQRPGVYDAQGVSNIMPIGVNQTLSFKGSAVHGGGSCQISLTTDKAPSKSTKWQVIHSIIGGCPASVVGNLPDDPSGSSASKFQFSIPEGISPGSYVLAWTWFNKIGNREMYMNCAPVTVTGGSSKREVEAKPAFTKRATSFPPMFVANVNVGTCTTAPPNAAPVNGEFLDLAFPDSGDSVQYAGTNPIQMPPTPAGCTFPGDSDSSASNASTPSASSPVASPSNSGGVFAQGAGTGSSPSAASSSSVVATPVASSAPSASSAAAPDASSAPAAAPSGTTSPTTSTAGALTGACTTEGEWNCIGGSSFQQCASGAWSAVQPMAQGTVCTAGESATLNMTAGKRGVRFSRSHLRRHMAGFAGSGHM
ncbi:hypothetical protein MMC06_005860 [Schaereria dolodes]|nr:hypothetical protein [Schaereria dolodes]